METSTKIGAVLLLFLLGFGIFQAFNHDLPKSSLAGAVTDRSQEQINGCMKDCMRACVTEQSLVESCTGKCEPQCGAEAF